MKKITLNIGNPEFAIIRGVFNLAGETVEDPERLAREAEQARRRQRDAAEYQAKMQRTFEQCPGFVGADAPAGPGQRGRVMVEPAKVGEANAWLKRRFHVNANLELSTDDSLCIEIMTRQKRVVTAGQRSIKVNFKKPEQFELQLSESETDTKAC